MMKKTFAALLTIGTIASALAGPVGPGSRPGTTYAQAPPLLAPAAPNIVASTTISQWTFETNPPADTTGPTPPPVTADVGSGTATAAHTTGATHWTTPTGNGSANSLSADSWNINDYFSFSLSTVGQTGVFVTFSQTSSSTGPGSFELQYSTNGGTTFSSGGTYTVSANSANWSTSSASFASSDEFTFNLSSMTALNNNAGVIFHLRDAATTAAGGGTVAAGGTSRVDNFFVSSGGPEYPPGFVAVPEPATWMLMGVGLLIGVQRLRRKA